MLVMVSSASTAPALVDGQFVFPTLEGNVSLSRISEIVEASTPPTLDVTLKASEVSLDAKVAKGTFFEIQYSCDMNTWSTLITATGESNTMDFAVSTSEIEENCAFFRIVTSN